MPQVSQADHLPISKCSMQPAEVYGAHGCSFATSSGSRYCRYLHIRSYLSNNVQSHFVSFAAILSTLSLFTSPITQQMISYSIRPTPDPLGKASIQFAQNVHYTDTIPDWIRRSNLATLGSRADSPVQPLPATCTTTKCTFPQYTSLAVCMKMVDISEHLTVTPVQIPAEMRASGNTSTISSWSMGSDWLPAVKEGNRTNPESTPAWNASLPNGMSYVTPLSYAAITWPFGGSMKDSIAFANNSDDKFTALANFFHIYSAAGNVSYPGYDGKQDDPSWEFHAFEILYYTCVNTYETVYEAGNSITKIVASSNAPFRGQLSSTSSPHTNTTTDPQTKNLPTYNAGCYFPPGLENDNIEGDICEHIEKPGTFTALSSPQDASKAYIMDRYVGATITGELFYKARNTYVGDGVPTHRGVSSGAGADAVKEALWGPAQRGNFTRQQTEDRLRAFMNGFATSLSNGLRTATGDAQALQGTSWSPETFIHINWGWIGFLAAQMGFSYLFLAVTIFRTGRLGVPVLKSSEIATLLAGTDGVRRVVGGLGDIEGAERNARGTRVVLELDEHGVGGKGARFVVVDGGKG